jgi:hypothetical protein
MNRAEKAARIRRILDGIYPDAPIPLRSITHDGGIAAAVAVAER